MSRSHLLLLLGALIVGLLVRIPGVLWGHDFPGGWYGHHPDEYTHAVNAGLLIDPSSPPPWDHPYPKGMATHVAVPFLAARALRGQLSETPPEMIDMIVVGRIIAVLYGTATILVLFLLARRLFRDPRIGVFAAWILALGGLHVTQSHFFVADVAGLFWFLMGSYLLLIELEAPEANLSPFLMAGAFCFGVAFGIKLLVFGLPTLGIIALLRQPRVTRAIYVAVFFIAGVVVVNLNSFTAYDLFQTFARGVSDPWQWSPWSSLLLYLIESPSLVSFPILLLALGGGFFLGRKLLSPEARSRFWPITLIVVMPMAIYVILVVFQLDHFLRHLIPFIPWIAIAAAWSLVQIADWLTARRLHPGLLIIPVFAYLVLFVYDGERVFLQEPRNEVALWIQQNLSSGSSYSWRAHADLEHYEHIYYPDQGRPDVIVIEMHHANHYLSGLSWKNSFPEDFRFIFDSGSQDRVDALQALFKGASEYREVARFSEGYFMPEYNLVDSLIGNRSRNYIAEIVIFKKSAEPNIED